jgi:hypothetical protein
VVVFGCLTLGYQDPEQAVGNLRDTIKPEKVGYHSQASTAFLGSTPVWGSESMKFKKKQTGDVSNNVSQT